MSNRETDLQIQLGEHLTVRLATKEVKARGGHHSPPTPLSSSLIRHPSHFYITHRHTQTTCVCVFSSPPHSEE